MTQEIKSIKGKNKTKKTIQMGKQSWLAQRAKLREKQLSIVINKRSGKANWAKDFSEDHIGICSIEWDFCLARLGLNGR